MGGWGRLVTYAIIFLWKRRWSVLEGYGTRPRLRGPSPEMLTDCDGDGPWNALLSCCARWKLDVKVTGGRRPFSEPLPSALAPSPVHCPVNWSRSFYLQNTKRRRPSQNIHPPSIHHQTPPRRISRDSALPPPVVCLATTACSVASQASVVLAPLFQSPSSCPLLLPGINRGGMNTSLTAYTHLESLLLFQSLHAHGLDPQVFSNISELLKTNPHITQNPTFQSGRLSPDALRNFYLHKLKEEIRSEQAQQNDDSSAAPNGKNSRKRKAPSPTLPTVQESAQHLHLIPKLVNKLYARYRSAIAEEIKRDEDQYEALQRELQGINRGLYDEQLIKNANAHSKPAPRSPQPPKHSQSLPQQNAAPLKTSPVSESAPVAPPPARVPTDGLQQQQQQQQQPPSPKPSTLPPVQNGPSQPDQNTKAASNTPRNKKQQSAVNVPTSQPALVPGPAPLQQNRPPSQPPVQPQMYTAPHPPIVGPTGSPFLHRPPYTQTQNQAQTQTAPPQGSPQPHTQGPPSHPPHLQPQPIQPFGPHYPPPHGTPSQYSPTHGRFSGSPSVQTPQQHRNFPPYSGHLPYHPQSHQSGQPPPQGGFMLPPFQVSPQDPSRAHQQPALPPHYPPVSTPVNARQTARATPQSSNAGRPNPPLHPLVTQQRHSLSTPTGMRTPISAFSTPRSAKSTIKGSARAWATPVQVPRPTVDDIDDFVAPQTISRDEPSQPDQPKAKPTRKSRAKGKAKEKEQEKDAETESKPEAGPEAEAEQAPEETVPEMETRQGRSRRKAPARKPRPGSIASSHAGNSTRERSRSHSILSHTETVAADNESQLGDRVKSERGNSIDVIEEDAASTPQMTTRRRGGTQSVQQATNKRKRNGREPTPEEADEESHTPGIPRTVIAPRQFSRMCAPLMQDISSHKHASIFTTAVRAKDAEGYYEIIKRPTDLKTIQKGIAAGAKQVAAAVSGDTPAGSPGGGGAIVELPMNVDNIPPKAILNSGQLEKELMRMFVNAVMFNPGEEGVVEDARETFESVQQAVSAWRSIERGSGRMEVEETPPVQDEDVPTASKRRKL
ncbi:hypothetical protein DM02DRAFT_734196 [Periconia macrospinosa]|uniref:Bromo domain-containing protein n=1 Tax=Periconia macrospinosa TaxID=97972 RepID=A0A2V1D050_9PLEO|nr:hypothetical protein DM02DRAFT_734196 [Periconia macrospinosa]